MIVQSLLDDFCHIGLAVVFGIVRRQGHVDDAGTMRKLDLGKKRGEG